MIKSKIFGNYKPKFQQQNTLKNSMFNSDMKPSFTSKNTSDSQNKQ